MLRITLLTLCLLIGWFVESASAQIRMPRGERQMVRKGLFQQVDSLQQRADSLALANLLLQIDSAFAAEYQSDSIALNALRTDEGGELDSLAAVQFLTGGIQADTTRSLFHEGWFMSDSMGLSKVCWMSAVVPGYGQIYNKQYWKLPILYGTLFGGLALYINENKTYKPLKETYDAMTDISMERTPELDALQTKMIRSNTKRQIYLGVTIASYIYFIGDAAVNYATNDVSDVKKATTLACICPGAGQIYNQSYWKVPFVIGGFATLGYCIDWNNRGYQRFKKAYKLLAEYEANPEAFPNGPTDEFRGRYSATFIRNLRNNYRRNRDLCIILTGAMYVLQIVDAHVDAHLKDYDISDDLSMNIEPMVDYTYLPTEGNHRPVVGFNMSINF
ncbi:MAG: hypothetical protein IJN55_04790 [Alistipes sp.]|nr:hypothetical protein [Rikenellaceae bacterium]MBQ6881864.1 hypothetical protein [Alistipes sp.]MBR1994268.1 hypothetical protein [Alistipes sp.]MBR3847274.1 hypothetical protein [Alistipes sp.]MBR7169739.1 hypothetical protein [Alistipes sp.]